MLDTGGGGGGHHVPRVPGHLKNRISQSDHLDTDARRPVTRLWIRSAEVRGEHR